VQDRYDPKWLEPRWQQQWATKDLFRAGVRSGAPKRYVLAMLPYPSGEMHMGHVRVYCITDVLARYARKRGFDVLHPLGWDSFGLPAENAAIKEGLHPAVRTPNNIASFKEDVNALGISIDWSRELSTSDPGFYKWNQWFFLRMMERGLVYRRRSRVNFCPSCNTVLANEQVEDGRCWRCGSVVQEREIPEWALRITRYADRLLEGLDGLDWPERDGLEIVFPVVGADEDDAFRVFTTRADTIFGATYVAAAPDHPLVQKLLKGAKRKEIDAFAERVRAAARQVGEGAAAAEKEGIDTGLRARNPFTGEHVPVWVANFVLAGYGTGAVMSVPAHDQRDFEFTQKYGLPVRWVVQPEDAAGPAAPPADKAFTEYGVLVESGDFTGLAQRRGIGRPTVNYHLRDWGISRQRYWGTPIPIVYCKRCDPEGKGIPVPDEDLPVLLPDIDVKEVLTGKGEPPLAKVPSFVNTKCPRCGGKARREVDTMDTFVDSSWYMQRYLSPHEDRAPFLRHDADRWLPVDVYVGGPEHAVLHLLYFRFWTKVMQEMSLCANAEPAHKLVTQGIVKGRDGEKMSKSRGNVVSPREIIATYGADTARLFILFAAPTEKDMEWSDEQVEGQFRFLGRLHRLFAAQAQRVVGKTVHASQAQGDALELRRKTHRTIARATQQLERLQFNTAISSLMELSNAASAFEPRDAGGEGALGEALETLAQLLAPFAPHMAEELWAALGHTAAERDDELSLRPWPVADLQLIAEETVHIAVQVNGKLRGEVLVPAAAAEEEIRTAAALDPKIRNWIDGKTVKKVVVIPKRLVNFVIA